MILSVEQTNFTYILKESLCLQRKGCQLAISLLQPGDCKENHCYGLILYVIFLRCAWFCFSANTVKYTPVSHFTSEEKGSNCPGPHKHLPERLAFYICSCSASYPTGGSVKGARKLMGSVHPSSMTSQKYRLAVIKCKEQHCSGSKLCKQLQG